MSVLEFDRVLVLATSHVTRETAAAFDAAGQVAAWRGGGSHPLNGHPALRAVPGLMVWEYGWMLYCGGHGDEVPEMFPELPAIFAKARAHGCEWVRFDCDGPEVEGLAVFDWERSPMPELETMLRELAA
jgi:hypothetical protein